MKSKHIILLLLVPLSEIKALFYNSNLRVSWYLFSDREKFVCNVLQDYSNIIIFGVILYYMACVKIDSNLRKICLFLFILNALDFIHLGLMDMQYFVAFKILLTFIVFKICTLLNRF